MLAIRSSNKGRREINVGNREHSSLLRTPMPREQACIAM
jgi:hypothetical protein